MMDKKMTLEQVSTALRSLDLKLMADAIDAELKSRGEAVAWGLVFEETLGINAPTTFKTEREANQYADDCGTPDKCSPFRIRPRVVPLYTAPPAPKTTDARIIEIAADVATRTVFANIESPLILDIVRAALEAALKETP